MAHSVAIQQNASHAACEQTPSTVTTCQVWTVGYAKSYIFQRAYYFGLGWSDKREACRSTHTSSLLHRAHKPPPSLETMIETHFLIYHLAFPSPYARTFAALPFLLPSFDVSLNRPRTCPA